MWKLGVAKFITSVCLLTTLVCLSACGKSEPSVPPKKAPKSPKAVSRQTVEKSPSVVSKPELKTEPNTTAGLSLPPARQAESPESEAAASRVQKIIRPPDTRPPYDDQALLSRGFHKAAAKRLILYSDAPKESLAELPPLADELYPQLEQYFGPLPPDSVGRPYQMTAFLMEDPQRFVDAGLLSENRIQPHEGWYRGNEFWWNTQPSDYYTRHLLLHEATHCFMHVMPAVDCPPWYVEGMAEWFGTHRRDPSGRLKIGVLPDQADEFPGWARIDVIQQEVAEGRLQDVEQIIQYTFNDFQKLPAYAWSWALCHYLNSHPRYQKPFQELAKQLMDGGFQRRATEKFAPHLADLKEEWLLFASQIQYGHDIARSEIAFHPGEVLPAGQESVEIPISAQRGWQSTQVVVEAGRTYQVLAKGRVTLADTGKPWISEPQGISIQYFAGQPLGRLLGCIRPDSKPSSASDSLQSTAKERSLGNRNILTLVPLGPQMTFVAPHSGLLLLRVNDAWDKLGDNAGTFQVKIVSKAL